MNNHNLIGDNTLQGLVSVLNGSKFYEDETIKLQQKQQQQTAKCAHVAFNWSFISLMEELVSTRRQ